MKCAKTILFLPMVLLMGLLFGLACKSSLESTTATAEPHDPVKTSTVTKP